MRKNRIHVMHNYLTKEAQKPDSKDSRVHGSAQSNRRRKGRSNEPDATTSLGKSLNPNSPSNIFRTDLSRLTPADSNRSSGSSGDASEHEGVESTTNKTPRMVSSEDKTGPNTDRIAQYADAVGEYEQPLVSGVGGSFEDSRYMQASTLEIPFNTKARLLGNNIGGSLEPFGIWPVFSDSSMHVNELKWSCSRRFGSSSLSMHWIPTLLRARHAFLSTLCISSAYDDLMSRALLPAHQQNGESLVNRIRVRQGVISLINDSMNDPEMRSADETMVAVLHVLNSEIMGCDDRSMRVHQIGLHEMIRERGGLDRLGVGGQLAFLLTM